MTGIDVQLSSIDGYQIGRWVEGGGHGPHQKWGKEHIDGWQDWFDDRTLPNGEYAFTKQDVLEAIEQLDTFPAQGP